MTEFPPEETAPTLVVNEEDFDAVPSRRRVNGARSVIVLTALVTLGALTAIFYRSVSVVEPNSAVVVVGDEGYDGAKVVITADRTPADDPVGVATVGAENAYKATVLLHPGMYFAVITLNDKVVLQGRFVAEPLKGALIELPPTSPKADAVKERPASRTRGG